MPDLDFNVLGASVPPHAAAPLLFLKLDVRNTPETERIHTVILQCQIQIESVKRRYSPLEKAKLRDLFGDPQRWGQTLRTMLWTHAQVTVPAFTGRTEVDLPVPCTYDLNVVGSKYFYALEDGEIPLLLLFSGSIFYAAADGRLQVSQISWSKEAAFRLPVHVWQQMIETYYPNMTWLTLHRDVFERLYAYKRRFSLPTWDHTIEQLLPENNHNQ